MPAEGIHSAVDTGNEWMLLLGARHGNRPADASLPCSIEVGIGLVLIAAAVLLARETGGLLVGESIECEQLARLRKIIASEPAVDSLGRLLTMQVGPDEALSTVEFRSKRGLRLDEVDQAIGRLEHAIMSQYPSIRHIFFAAGSIKSSLRPEDLYFVTLSFSNRDVLEFVARMKRSAIRGAGPRMAGPRISLRSIRAASRHYLALHEN